MKLLSDKKFDIKDYYGDLVIMYHEKSAAHVATLRERLDASGHVYHCCPIGPSMLLRHDYISEITSLMNGCSCFAPVITEDILADDSRIFRSILWYFIGFMRSRLQDGIVPFIPKGEKATLAETPLQGVDIMYDEDSFMSTLLGKFADKLLRNNYYPNRTTNIYASRRILYHCLSLKFKIYEEAFQNAKSVYREYTSRRITDAAFDAYLEENLMCGCKVISFGSDERLEPQMMVYKDEVHPEVDDMLRSLTGKKIYRRLTEEECEESGVRAEFTMDVLIPVHKLLGAYVKCYLTCLDSDCPVYMLLALMESDFTGKEASEYDEADFDSADFWRGIYPEETHIEEKLNRFYFGLNFEKPENPVTPDPALRVGEFMDFIFPQ